MSTIKVNDAKRKRVLSSLFKVDQKKPVSVVYKVLFIKGRGFMHNGTYQRLALGGAVNTATGRVMKIMAYDNSYQRSADLLPELLHPV